MATNISITNLPTGYQSIISNGRHSILGDEPIKSKGTDLGFSPVDLILSSIAMCKVATVRFVARKYKWDALIRDVKADLSIETKRGKDRKLSTNVKVALHIEGNITEEQRAKLIKEANACYVHRMIEGEWNIEDAVALELEETV